MAKDTLYTNGVIAVKEKYLLKDKIFKLCEGSAEDTLRTLSESGFGKGAEVTSVYDYERLIAADEKSINDFIREYSPSEAEKKYLLAPRDFHNAKAIVKARWLGLELDKLVAPEGTVSLTFMVTCINDGNYGALGEILGGAVRECAELFSDENKASGAEIGNVFEKALYEYLCRNCYKNALLKKLIAAKADMTNILTAMRSAQPEYAEKCYVTGGKLSFDKLAKLFSDDREKAACALDGTQYAEFVKKCFEDKSAGLPLTRAEKICESYEAEYFSAKRYELAKSQPFMFYVFRRRAENADARILFVCQLAGMKDTEIRKRLRSF